MLQVKRAKHNPYKAITNGNRRCEEKKRGGVCQKKAAQPETQRRKGSIFSNLKIRIGRFAWQGEDSRLGRQS